MTEILKRGSYKVKYLGNQKKKKKKKKSWGLGGPAHC